MLLRCWWTDRLAKGPTCRPDQEPAQHRCLYHPLQQSRSATFCTQEQKDDPKHCPLENMKVLWLQMGQTSLGWVIKRENWGWNSLVMQCSSLVAVTGSTSIHVIAQAPVLRLQDEISLMLSHAAHSHVLQRTMWATPGWPLEKPQPSTKLLHLLSSNLPSGPEVWEIKSFSSKL